MSNQTMSPDPSFEQYFQTRNMVVYDLETQKTFDEIGATFGQKNQHLLQVSFLGLYSYDQQKYFGFFEKDLPNLEKILFATRPLIIGFNTKAFDNLVLQPYFQKLELASLPQLDILDEVYRQLGFRLKLETLAQACLGEGKSGSGLDAIKYWRPGNLSALTKYCMDDVRITKAVYEYGLRHGQLLYTSAGEIRGIPVSWGQTPPMRDLVDASAQQHLQLEIEYWEFGKISERQLLQCVIDVIARDDNKITALCHTPHLGERIFDLRHILNAHITDQTFAHQTVLF